MNQMLEKAIDDARGFSEHDQEALGTEFLKLIEERAVGGKIANAEAQGGGASLEGVFSEIKDEIKNNYAL